MKKIYAMVIIEFQKKDEETLNDAIDVVKSNIENCLGGNAVKYVSICNEDGEVE